MIHRDHRLLFLWLAVCTFLVVCMVAVGGYTRLSGSGLSITAWKPVYGVIPPLNEREWNHEFEAYRATPQYAKVNAGMTIEEFRQIYWPEYWHRVLGRLIGIVFLAPFLSFLARRSFDARFGWTLAGIFALGGTQGLMGWVMVASGLVDHPYVAHTKLAMHLGLAFVLMGWLWLCALRTRKSGIGNQKMGISRFLIFNSQFLLFLLFLQIMFGALLAGQHGGLVYNTFPTMNGQWIPDGLNWNIIDDITTIQFIHRWLAMIVFFGAIFWWWRVWKSGISRGMQRLGMLTLAVLFLQLALGVATLLHHVPLSLALLHQLNAAALWLLMITGVYRIHHDL